MHGLAAILIGLVGFAGEGEYAAFAGHQGPRPGGARRRGLRREGRAEAGRRRPAHHPGLAAQGDRLEDAPAIAFRRRFHDHRRADRPQAAQAGPGGRRGGRHGDRVPGHQSARPDAGAPPRAEQLGGLPAHRERGAEQPHADANADANANADADDGHGDGAGRQAPEAAAPDVPRGRRVLPPGISPRGEYHPYQVLDDKTGKPRYLGQAQFQQPQDVAAVKLFVTNRNGIEPIDVIVRDITIRADRINGLGTIVRTVFDNVVYADPTCDREGHPDRWRSAQGTPGSRANAQPGTPAPGCSAGHAGARRRAGPARGRRRRAGPGTGRGGRRGGAADRVRRVVAAAPVAAAPNVAAQPGGPAANAPPKTLAEPKKIPLDEVDSIHYERSPGMTARFVDQPNLDLHHARPQLQAGEEGRFSRTTSSPRTRRIRSTWPARRPRRRRPRRRRPRRRRPRRRRRPPRRPRRRRPRRRTTSTRRRPARRLRRRSPRSIRRRTASATCTWLSSTCGRRRSSR